MSERENSCNSYLTASWCFNIEIKDSTMTKLILIKSQPKDVIQHKISLEDTKVKDTV